MPRKLPRTTLLAGLAVLLLALGLVLRSFFPNSEPGPTETSSAPPTRISPRPVRTDSSPNHSHVPSQGIRNFSPSEYPRALLEDHLNHRQRNAESLLAAFRISNELHYLHEAFEKFPNRPEVLLALIENTRDPSERLVLLEALKRNDPDNAIGNLLSAKALLELGRTGEALAELSAAYGKDIRDFSRENTQYAEEAWLAQLPPAEARWAAFSSSTKTSLMSLGTMSRQLAELTQELTLAGDLETSDHLRGVQSHFGKQLQKTSSPIIDHLVGLTLEKRSLHGLDTQQAEEMRAEIDTRQSEITETGKRMAALFETRSIPDADLLIYIDRIKNLGEVQASRWLLEQYGGP